MPTATEVVTSGTAAVMALAATQGAALPVRWVATGGLGPPSSLVCACARIVAPVHTSVEAPPTHPGPTTEVVQGRVCAAVAPPLPAASVARSGPTRVPHGRATAGPSVEMSRSLAMAPGVAPSPRVVHAVSLPLPRFHAATP